MDSSLSTTTRLPLPISSFIGRESELATIHDLLTEGARLITFVGPGGVGKTRLALEVCVRESLYFPHGVSFVTLEAISNTEFILPEIARGLSVELSGTASLLDDLARAVADKRLLLCIDNWEHLVEAAVQIAPLVAACPNLQIVSTSREALRLRGEQVFRVEPLLLQSPHSPHNLELAAEAQAVQLFLDRARAVRPGFDLDGRNTAVVVEICSLVDGLPLAVELAAAMMRLFSPDALLARLKKSVNFANRSGSVGLLVGGPRDLPARQQTLHSTIAWSYGLLDPDEQRVFRRMAVFAGGCDLEAVEAVCGAGTDSKRSLLDSLISLVDKSLVRVQEVNGEPRFTMLRTIQEYALDQLLVAGETAETQQCHAFYYNELAERLINHVNGAIPTEALARLDREHDNWRAGLNWSLDHHRIAIAHELCRSLFRFWLTRGLLLEGRLWLDRTLALEGDISTELRATVVFAASILALHQGDLAGCREHLNECLLLRRQSDDIEGVASALIMLGVVELGLASDLNTILSHIHEGIELSKSNGSQLLVAHGLIKAGWALFNHRQYESAEEYAMQALEAESSSGDQRPALFGNCWHLLGVIAATQGNYEQAHQMLEKAKLVLYQTGFRVDSLQLECDLGKLAIQRNRLEEAEDHLLNALKGSIDIQDRLNTIDVLDGLMCLAAVRSAASVAAKLWGACTAARSALAVPRLKHDEAFCDSYVYITRTKLGDDSFLISYQNGETMSFEEAVRFAMEPYSKESSKPTPKVGRAIYPAGLTSREVDVLRLVAQGLSDNEVAEKLVLSPRTVNAHLTSIYSKLDVNSRVAATRFAIENGLAT